MFPNTLWSPADCKEWSSTCVQLTYCDICNRRGLEVLMRKILLYQNRPAIIYTHLWMPGYDQHSFYNSTIEEETELLVKYYGLQSVSLRNMVFHDYAVDREGFRERDLACTSYHPSYLGHRYPNKLCELTRMLSNLFYTFMTIFTLSRYVADLLVGLIQDNLLYVILTSKSPWHGNVQNRIQVPDQLPRPMIADNYETKTYCLTEGKLRDAVISAQVPP